MSTPSQNALKHGLFAASPVLPNEDPAPFEALRQSFIRQYKPANLLEHQLTADLANLRWRLLRCQALENKILTDDSLATQAQIETLAKFSLYEHRLTRKFTQTLKQLQTLQAERPPVPTPTRTPRNSVFSKPPTPAPPPTQTRPPIADKIGSSHATP